MRRIALHPKSSYLLFGSVARGDANAGSDIDVLELTSDEHAVSLPQSAPAQVSMHVYSEHRLRALFSRGSLFALHLHLEGRVLRDPGNRLARICSLPVQVDFEELRARVRAEVVVLRAADIDPGAPRAYAIARHLLRTAAFAECARRGTPTFSIARAARLLGEPTLHQLLEPAHAADVERFTAVRAIVERMVGCQAPPLPTSLSTLATRGLHFARQLAFTGLERETLAYDPESELFSAAA